MRLHVTSIESTWIQGIWFCCFPFDLFQRENGGFPGWKSDENLRNPKNLVRILEILEIAW